MNLQYVDIPSPKLFLMVSRSVSRFEMSVQLCACVKGVGATTGRLSSSVAQSSF